jgi:hypothetical protein
MPTIAGSPPNLLRTSFEAFAAALVIGCRDGKLVPALPEAAIGRACILLEVR